MAWTKDGKRYTSGYEKIDMERWFAHLFHYKNLRDPKFPDGFQPYYLLRISENRKWLRVLTLRELDNSYFNDRAVAERHNKIQEVINICNGNDGPDTLHGYGYEDFIQVVDWNGVIDWSRQKILNPLFNLTHRGYKGYQVGHIFLECTYDDSTYHTLREIIQTIEESRNDGYLWKLHDSAGDHALDGFETMGYEWRESQFLDNPVGGEDERSIYIEEDILYHPKEDIVWNSVEQETNNRNLTKRRYEHG